MAAQKPHSDCSDNKRTLKFLGEIQAMIDNNPSKSIRSTARNIRVSEFLIRQIVHEGIQCFFIQDKKGTIFITGHEG